MQENSKCNKQYCNVVRYGGENLNELCCWSLKSVPSWKYHTTWLPERHAYL